MLASLLGNNPSSPGQTGGHGLTAFLMSIDYFVYLCRQGVAALRPLLRSRSATLCRHGCTLSKQLIDIENAVTDGKPTPPSAGNGGTPADFTNG